MVDASIPSTNLHGGKDELSTSSKCVGPNNDPRDAVGISRVPQVPAQLKAPKSSQKCLLSARHKFFSILRTPSMLYRIVCHSASMSFSGDNEKGV